MMCHALTTICKPRSLWLALIAFLSMAACGSAFSADFSLGGVSVSLDDGGSPEGLSKAFQILLLLTALSLVPALVVVLTAFTRIIIVLAMLRHAFGMPSTPPNTVLTALALFLTLFTMMPVVDQIEKGALEPFQNNNLTAVEAVREAMLPLREFMVSQTREEDLALILELADKPKPRSLSELDNSTLIPAFMLSELRTAFMIGFIIFLPFLLIDLITASVLMAMGMIMVPPLTISLPLKVLMFVLIDGWVLVAHSLISSFQ